MKDIFEMILIAIASLLNGALFTSLLITHSDDWKFCLPVILICLIVLIATKTYKK